MEPIYMNCFICDRKINAADLTKHLIECKKVWEAKLRLEEGGGILETYDKYKEDKKKYKEYCQTIKQSKIPEKIKRQPGQRPRTVHCPLCDIEFSIGAWKIHIKRCREKELESSKYCNEKYRNEIDELINRTMKSIEGITSVSKKIKTKGKYDIDNLGDEAYEMPSNLVTCSSCGRSFAKDKIEKHQNICFKHPELFRKK